MAATAPLALRLIESIELDGSGCWLWTRALDRHGYGRIKEAGQAMTSVRAAYLSFVGPLAPGYEPDHLCRVRRCVNPAHLEAVTKAENCLRGESFAAVNARKTHCPNGHAYDDANTYVLPNGHRGCKACRRGASRAYRQRKRTERKVVA